MIRSVEAIRKMPIRGLVMVVDTPTERCVPILCTTDTTNGEGRMIVQANEALTALNNRLYRQSRVYPVKFSCISTGDSSAFTYEFYTLPNTWFVHGAVKHAYSMYMQSMSEELAAGIPFAKWHDFKINEQNPDAIWEYSRPALFDGDGWAQLVSDEAVPDISVTDSAGTAKGFHIIGNLTNSFNVLREYANALKYRQTADDTVSSNQPYEGLLDLKDADVMAEKGDLAPYDRDFGNFLPDDATVDDATGHTILNRVATITFDGNAGFGRMTTPWFDAPLGLVYVHRIEDASLAQFGTGQPELCLHFKPGKYKGVTAPSLL